MADYFVQKQRNGDYIPSREMLKHVEAVLGLLSVMTGDTRFEDVLNESGGSDNGGVTSMCDVLDRVEARGEIRGAIKTYKRVGKLPAEIICFIMDEYDLPKDEAEKCVEETLGLQLVGEGS